MHTLSRLLLLLGAIAGLSVASARLSIKTIDSTSFDLQTRFLETIYHERPTAFYPFLRQLQQYQIRPKTVFSDPAFKSSKTLEGKPRPSKYKDHNPIFTTLALPFEAFQALEASFARSRLWRDRGASLIWKTSLANDVALPTLTAMNEVWEKREKEIKGGKNCQSWIDLKGEKVCTSDEFWKLVGTKQIFVKDPIKIESSNPDVYTFDRFLPSTRNESLPLVILYAAPTDEGFPALYDLLHKLAQPPAGYPRLQFALRWKINTEAPATTFSGRYDVKAELEGNVEVIEDLSSRAVAFIEQSDNKLSNLSQIASSLPLLSAQLASIDVPESISSSKNSVEHNNVVILNKKQISNSQGIDFEALLDVMRIDGRAINNLASITHVDEELARIILLGSKVDLEDPKKDSKGPVMPTVEQPLEFVNLVEATRDVLPLVTKASYIEGATNEEDEADPPALASIFLVADLEASRGRKQVEQVLKFLDSATRVRFAFLHRPSRSEEAVVDRNAYAFSSLLYSLVASKELAEVYPSELLEFLKLEIGVNGPKRSLNDMWTQDNPITPFLEGGLKEDEHDGAKKYLENVKKFASKLGLKEGEEAIIINGRIVRLGDSVVASATLNNLLQYELKHRIRPVAEVALRALPQKLEQDRVLQAELVNMATSIIASSVEKSRPRVELEIPSSIPSFSISNSSIIPMYELTAILDPTSTFSRKVTPILSALSRESLFTLTAHLSPTSLQPSEREIKTLWGSAFSTKPKFEEEEGNSLREIEPSVDFSGIEQDTAIDVTVEVDGEEVTEKRKVMVGGGKEQTVVLEKLRSKAGEGEKVAQHTRDEL